MIVGLAVLVAYAYALVDMVRLAKRRRTMTAATIEAVRGRVLGITLVNAAGASRSSLRRAWRRLLTRRTDPNRRCPDCKRARRTHYKRRCALDWERVMSLHLAHRELLANKRLPGESP